MEREPDNYLKVCLEIFNLEGRLLRFKACFTLHIQISPGSGSRHINQRTSYTTNRGLGKLGLFFFADIWEFSLQDFLGLVEKFFYLSGRYDIQLTVGDAVMVSMAFHCNFVLCYVINVSPSKYVYSFPGELHFT